MKRYFYAVIIILIAILPAASALNYYADLEIEVSETGDVSFSGLTNHPALQGTSTQYTSKQGEYWLLNITFEELFSDYVYRLTLPRNAQVNYIKTPQLSRIEDEGRSISIIGLGENTRFVVIVQYSIKPKISGSSPALYGMIALAAVMLIALAYFLLKVKKVEEKFYNLDAMTERQKEILKLLEKHGRPLTQAELEKHTGLPKSSLSRNIDSLVRKNILKKESKGMTNIVYINKKK